MLLELTIYLWGESLVIDRSEKDSLSASMSLQRIRLLRRGGTLDEIVRGEEKGEREEGIEKSSTSQKIVTISSREREDLKDAKTDCCKFSCSRISTVDTCILLVFILKPFNFGFLYYEGSTSFFK